MKKFESVIIVNNNLIGTEKEKLTSKVEEKIKNEGSIIEKKVIGERKLAYEIKNNKEGYYVSYQFELDDNCKDCTNCIRNIERFFRTQEDIIKFIIVDL